MSSPQIHDLAFDDENEEKLDRRRISPEDAADLLEQRRAECGIPFWPHAFVTAHCDVDTMLEAWSSEFACLGYGEHLYDEIVAFCELTGIECIAL